MFRLLVADEQFRRRDARELIEQRVGIAQLDNSKFPGSEIGVGKAKQLVIEEDGAEVIRSLRFEKAEIAYRPGADDLRDFAGNDLAGLRVTGLITDRDTSSGLDQLRDVTLRGMI